MKRILFVAAAAVMVFSTGCASHPVAVAAVGPNPAVTGGDTAAMGQLEVISPLQGRTEGDNPVWYQHADYLVCNAAGRKLFRVDNAAGHYERAPRVLALRAGRYLVRARAKGYLLVQVPVVVEPGRITRVHLDGSWKAPSPSKGTKLVSLPDGYAVGWSATAGANARTN